MSRPFAVAVLALCLGSTGAFAPPAVGVRTVPTLSMSKDNQAENDGGKRFAAAAVGAAYLLSGLFAADAAFAAPVPSALDFAGDSSTVVLAGRSGGRAGGRASSASARPAPSRSSSSSTTIHKTTVIQQPPTVVVAPPPMSYGYGYAPAPPGPGLGLALTVGAIDAIGDGMREARQNNEIRNTRAQLEVERQKEFELEQRLRMVEMNQMSQRQAPMPMMAAPQPMMAPQQ